MSGLFLLFFILGQYNDIVAKFAINYYLGHFANPFFATIFYSRKNQVFPKLKPKVSRPYLLFILAKNNKKKIMAPLSVGFPLHGARVWHDLISSRHLFSIETLGKFDNDSVQKVNALTTNDFTVCPGISDPT